MSADTMKTTSAAITPPLKDGEDVHVLAGEVRILDHNTRIASLKVDPGGSVDFNGFALTVEGTFDATHVTHWGTDGIRA